MGANDTSSNDESQPQAPRQASLKQFPHLDLAALRDAVAARDRDIDLIKPLTIEPLVAPDQPAALQFQPVNYSFPPGYRIFGDRGSDSCTISCFLNLIQAWSYVKRNQESPFTASALQGNYQAANHGSNIGGIQQVAALNYWINPGLQASFPPQPGTTKDHANNAGVIYSLNDIQNAAGSPMDIMIPVSNIMKICGGMMACFNLPKVNLGQHWTVPANNPPVNNDESHCVAVLACDLEGLTICSWGQVCTVTWTFLTTYSFLGYAIMDLGDWPNAPDGSDMSNLFPKLFPVGRQINPS